MQAKIFALVLVAVAVAEGAKCPEVTGTAFDISGLTGDWYIKQELPQSFFFPTKCVKNTYGKVQNGAISVSKNWRFKWFPLSLFSLTTEFTDVPSDTSKGTFIEKKQTGILFKSQTPYTVLEGDSNSYVLLYSCQPHLFGKTEKVYVLSNSLNDLTSIAEAAVHQALQKVDGMAASYLVKHDQSCWSQ